MYAIDQPSQETPPDAPYELGRIYKTSGEVLVSPQTPMGPFCKWCGGKLIGKEIGRGLCGADDRRVG